MSYSEVAADGTILGDVPGIKPGTFFRDRQELYDRKLHRALMSVSHLLDHQSFFRAAT